MGLLNPLERTHPRGQYFHDEYVAKILNPLGEDDWNKGPEHVNPIFADLLAT